jgi:glutamate transport system permease protein
MSAILYDALGPAGRRRVAVGSAVAIAGLAVVGGLAVIRLVHAGQFEGRKWSPILNPADAQFTTVWRFLAGGAIHTLEAAAFAMVFSLVIGTVLASARVVAAPWYRWLLVSVIELLRGVPVVMAIFFASRVLPQVGIDLSLVWYLVIGLTAYNSVVIAEIIRAGVQALPRGQTEAAYAIGLTRGATLRLVLLPQAFRIMLPALIGQLVVVLKDTSLGAFIGYEELLRRGNIGVQNLHNPIQLYLLIAGMFITINLAVSRLATVVERRISGDRRSLGGDVEAEIVAVEGQSAAAVGA